MKGKKVKQITMTRLVLNKDERAIQQTWKEVWSRMKKEEEKYGYFYIISGDWSGYTSSQYQITHVDWLPWHEAKRLQLRLVEFSDNTTMGIQKDCMTLSGLIQGKIKRRLQYTSLIEKAIATGKATYAVKAN